MRYLLILACLVLISGCGPRFVVTVDSISGSQLPNEKTYVLLPMIEGVTVDDLQFQEYAGYVEKALSQQNYRMVTDFEKARYAILLNYGIGDPQESTYSYSLPVYGQRGGGTSNFSASTYGAGGYSNTYGTISSTPTYGVVGSQGYTGRTVSYFRYLVIEGVDLELYRKNRKTKQLWKTTVTSSGSSGDLRRVFPILATASIPYLGTNTGKQIRIQMYESNKLLKEIKGVE